VVPPFRLIAAEGPEYSTVSTRSFSALFILADFLCLVVQGVGGGIAGTAATTAGSNNGGYIMTAGVVLQCKSIPLLLPLSPLPS
jgi:hypothetical protein